MGGPAIHRRCAYLRAPVGPPLRIVPGWAVRAAKAVDTAGRLQ
ncbi:hypothetical protein PSO31014_01641 [Pandoraea soli]|uniref:Uncharacterized protein n=1 Tax=Pandoraea soli TaxID=2508293 RepID=A0ABY6VX28_9BURK|nr:hypothetical protein PSO31014_01641 [Pandoraea soli]